MTTVSYAQSGSPGQYASQIGWINFVDAKPKISSNERFTITNNINDEVTITFDVYSDEASGFNPQGLIADVPFGTTGYTGLVGDVVLTNVSSGPNTRTLYFDNIIVKTIYNQIVTDYTIVVADAEQTIISQQNRVEYWKFTNEGGSNWVELVDLASGVPPALPPVPGTPGTSPSTNLNNLVATTTGTQVVLPSNNIKVAARGYACNSPKKIIAESQPTPSTRQSMAIGVILNSVPPVPPVPPDNTVVISCGLEVGINNEDKMILVCPGRPQYFTATALKCCGSNIITITRDPQVPSTELLGSYELDVSGILFTPNQDIKSRPNMPDTLPLIATDDCGRFIRFNVRFIYSPCSGVWML